MWGKEKWNVHQCAVTSFTAPALTINQKSLSYLQLVPNAAARRLTDLNRRHHIMLILAARYWPLVQFGTAFMILLLF